MVDFALIESASPLCSRGLSVRASAIFIRFLFFIMVLLKQFSIIVRS